VAHNKTAHQGLEHLFSRWREAEGKIRLYGSSMPQSTEILDDFHSYLSEIFTQIDSFSIVKHANGVENHNTQYTFG
jgi:hypothetical protein